MLPALAIVFTGVFCLVKFNEEQRRAWLILTAFLFAILMDYKVFATLHLLIALSIAALVYLSVFRDTRLIKVLVLTTLMALPLVLYSLFGTEAGARVSVRVDPWPYIPRALQQLGLLNTPWGHQVAALFSSGAVTTSSLAALFLVALPGYLLGSLGLRVIAVPGLLRELFSPSPSTGVRFFAALFVLLGPLITLTCRVSPGDYPGDYNNAVWFYVQSKYVAWLFVTGVVLTLCRRKKLRWQALIVAMTLACAVPSGAQFFERVISRFVGQPATVLDADELEVINYLNEACSDSQTVIAQEPLDLHVAALTACRVAMLRPLGIINHSFASRKELEQRLVDHTNFWHAWTGGHLRADILQRYHTAYLIVRRSRQGPLSIQEYVWISDNASREDGLGVIGPLFENRGFVIYQVSSLDMAEHSPPRTAGQVIVLLGSHTGPATVRRCDIVEVSLWLQGLAEMDRDYTAFIHLMDPQGHIWAQQDRLLQHGDLPTSAWTPGEIIRERYVLELPPDAPVGEYVVKAGIYYWETGERLPLWDEHGLRATEDAIVLDSVVVAE